MTTILTYTLATAEETEAFGARLAAACPSGVCIHLHGDLAAGKTTLARGYLRGLGHVGAVKSPTFTLVESYTLHDRTIHHFDLYRLADAAELEFIGIEEYLESGADCLFEWAERGAALLPSPDLQLDLVVIDGGRALTVVSRSECGNAVIFKIT